MAAALFLLGTLPLPLLAVYRAAGGEGLAYTAGWFAFWSLIAGFATVADKRKAQRQAWREPEFALHLLEILGGWPGAFVAQRAVQHKTAKVGYQLIFWLIVALYQLLAIDWLCAWPTLRQIRHLLS